VRAADCCGWHRKTVPECLDFKVGDEVETPYAGQWTRHRITARFRTKYSQSKVVYVVDPPVHMSTQINGGKIDAAWFRKPTEPAPAGSR